VSARREHSLGMTRTLVLMRHGASFADTLTVRGVDQVRDVASQLIHAGVRPDVILHSFCARAAQTAVIIAERYRAVGIEAVEIRGDFNLSSETGRIPLAAAKMNDGQTILAVAHAPDIERAMAVLAGMYDYDPDYAGAVVVTSEESAARNTAHPPPNIVGRRFEPSF
jgi:phosphohistidine phosphatase SixA